MKFKVIVLLWVLVLLSCSLICQDEEETRAPASLWEMLKATGPVGIVILTSSIIGIALSIEAITSLKMNKLSPPYLVQELDRLIENQEFDEAIQLCENNNVFLGNVMSEALARLAYGYEEMKRGLEKAIEIESFKLMVKISYINLIGQLGPLLGLLGTVTGMIATFREMSTLTFITTDKLSKGVYESLVNTAGGLFTAIILLSIHFILKNKVEKLSLSIGSIANAFLEKTKTFLEQE
ncbi:MAG: MotA/TolQ/ExbB proton channel family protein [Planctomycetota bacterium]